LTGGLLASVGRGLGFLALLAGLTLACAGDPAWGRGWMYLGLWAFGALLNLLVTARCNPALLAERWKGRPDTRRFDRVLLALYLPAFLAQPAVGALDAARFAWAPLPAWSVWPGLALHLAGMALVAWALAVNPHLEATVRLQQDRDHRVTTRGPYRLVRHPYALGMLLGLAGVPLVLGSAWAMAPWTALVAIFTARTALEDAFLKRELAGYREYAGRTRHRLLPGVW
jgi:protein-S-isoprenylcysteine O-methyltransferase Ste14